MSVLKTQARRSVVNTYPQTRLKNTQASKEAHNAGKQEELNSTHRPPTETRQEKHNPKRPHG
jgi:hypothetical protein